MPRFETVDGLSFMQLIFAVLHASLLSGARADTDMDHYGVTHDQSHQQMCYSCMSMDKEQTWPYLQHVYYKPLNFTDQCNRPMIPYKIGLVPCSSVCVVITEMRLVSGHFAGYSFTRGCIHSIAKNGFRNTTLRDYHLELRPACERLPRNAIFYKSNPTIEDQVYICTCFGDRCNDDRMNNAVSNRRLNTFSGLAFSKRGEAWSSLIQFVVSLLVFPVGLLFTCWSYLLIHDIRFRCS